jgi:dTDP-4-amino-4,6-dideoxygalactose transaminase
MIADDTSVREPLAILGGSPSFEGPLPVGQLYFPPWNDYEIAFRELFARQYYTNQGPLTDRFEAMLSERLNVRHALCVTNATIGLSMVADALNIVGRVILPSFTFVASAQAMIWSNLRPIFCDVDPKTHHMDIEQLDTLLAEGAEAVLAVNLWGDSYNMAEIEKLAQRYSVPLIFDSAHGFGCSMGGRPLGGFGIAEVFSFHATKVMSTCEGGCITTNDDTLAEKLRNIRSSYGVRSHIPVRRSSNGRMSEAQAAIGLLNLENLEQYINRNQLLHERYRNGLESISGLSVRVPRNVDKSNWQYLVCEIDEVSFGLSRDQLQLVLQKEGVVCRRYFFPGVHRWPPFSQMNTIHLPETDRLCTKVLQLPLGARTDERTISRISTLVRSAHLNADLIRAALTGQLTHGPAK